MPSLTIFRTRMKRSNKMATRVKIVMRKMPRNRPSRTPKETRFSVIYCRVARIWASVVTNCNRWNRTKT